MNRSRLAVFGSLPALFLVVLALAAARPALALGIVTVTTETTVEKVRYGDGTTDKRRPFKPLVAGEAAFLRVTVLTDAAVLPAGVARLRLEFGRPLADANVRMVERDGVRQCLRIDETVVSCVVERVLPGDEASMLVKLEIPAGLQATELWFRGTVVAIGDIVVKAKPTYARLETVGRGPWSGIWHWYATWDTGQWDGDGMQIYQPRDNGRRVVCARWPWAGGGAAWGTINERGVWHAIWRDGFGQGTWKLQLLVAGEFTGTQIVLVHGGNDFTADITGKRTSRTIPGLDCDAVLEELSGATPRFAHSITDTGRGRSGAHSYQ